MMEGLVKKLVGKKIGSLMWAGIRNVPFMPAVKTCPRCGVMPEEATFDGSKSAYELHDYQKNRRLGHNPRVGLLILLPTFLMLGVGLWLGGSYPYSALALFGLDVEIRSSG